MVGRGAGYAALAGRAMGGMGYWAWVIFIGLGRHWLALDGNMVLGGFVFRGRRWGMGGMGLLGCMGLRFRLSRLGDGVRLPFVGGCRRWGMSFSRGTGAAFSVALGGLGVGLGWFS